ncbi:Gp15 family bacteriophage protein [Enterococcus diestrammenae]|uniref:Gp15 family bacteriophage protein n=1 Tax=Enterococcus diestrammenae TaxID=1155073 RepID=UPI0019571D0F
MFRLDEKFTDEIQIDDVVYPLDFSFDQVLTAFRALKDQEMTFFDRLQTYLELLIVGDIPESTKWIKAYEEINQLITTEQTTGVRYDLNGDPMPTPKKDKEPDFDFDADARYIYAAFMQTYRIDLINQQGELHWTKFVALLNALPDDTVFRQIRQIRSTDLSKIKDPEQRERIRKQKAEFALPDRNEAEVIDYGG